MNHIAEETTRANLRQWQAVLGPDEWGRPLVQEPKICRCDGCGAPCDLNDDGTVIDERSDEVFCGRCLAAPYATEESR